MQNFEYHNPVRIVFGRGTIARAGGLVPAGTNVLMTYGGGSIKANGVHAQTLAALSGFRVLEFGGIEPNPQYATLMKAARICREQNVGFLLAVGGGSVLDGTKFIAAAAKFPGAEPWDILEKAAPVGAAIPLGAVLTLPATGSEMNSFAVISRAETGQKLAFASPLLYPVFSILDPETTCSLPPRQTANGIVDTWVHVAEQYLTFPDDHPLQDRQAEAILRTLLEEGPKVLARPDDYAARANVMWSATQALNGLIGCGVAQDWSTHMIGHELTALYGIDHAQSLAVVLPQLLRRKRANKRAKLLHYATRVWDLTGGSEDARIEEGIARTEAFFRSLGVPTRLRDYGIPADRFEFIADRLVTRNGSMGERQDVGREDILSLLRAAV